LKQALRAEAAALQARAVELEGEIQLTQSALERITNAVASLEGKVIQQGVKAIKRRKASTPAARRAEIISCIATLLQDNGVVDEADLIALTKDKLRQSGFSLLGFTLRFKEALAQESFRASSHGIQLAGTKEPKQQTKKAEHSGVSSEVLQ